MDNPFTIKKGRKGHLTALFDNKYIYSAYDPYREAANFLSGKGGIRRVIITCGGMDYLNMAAASTGCDYVISLEPVEFPKLDIPGSFCRVRTTKELEKILLQKNLHASDCTFLIWPALIEALPGFYSDVLTEVKIVLEKVSLSNRAALEFGALELYNAIRTLSGIKHIKYLMISGKEREVPALICSSGPGLIDHVNEIKKNRSNLWCLALPGAVSYLEANDITPDAVIAVDPGFGTVLHLDTIRQDIPVITTINIHSSLFSNSHLKPLFFSYNNMLEQFLYKDTGICVSPAEGSVVLNGIRIASQLGFKDCILCGQDFAYRGSRSHSPGANFEEWLCSRSDYRRSLEMKLVELDFRHDLRSIEGHSVDLYTTPALEVYYNHFIAQDFPINLYVFPGEKGRMKGLVQEIDKKKAKSLFAGSVKGVMLETGTIDVISRRQALFSYLAESIGEKEGRKALFCDSAFAESRVKKLLNRLKAGR
jgi:hypothetical protein